MSTTMELAAALAKAQAAFHPVKKNHKARVPLKSGGSYEYAYATLDDVIVATRAALAAEGLAVVQRLERPDAGTIGVETSLLHASGEQWAGGLLVLPCGDTPQQIGSALTYARRYSMSAALGVAAEEDDDGQQAQAAKPKPAATRREPSASAAAVRPDVHPADEEIPANTFPPEYFPADEPAPAKPSGDARLITEGQRRRLYAIGKSAGWPDDEMRQVVSEYGFEHSKDITRGAYDSICAALKDGRP